MVTYAFMMLFVFVLISIVDTCIKFSPFFGLGVVCITTVFMMNTCATTYHLDFYQKRQTSPPSCWVVSSRCGPCCCETKPGISKWIRRATDDRRWNKKRKRSRLYLYYKHFSGPLLRSSRATSEDLAAQMELKTSFHYFCRQLFSTWFRHPRKQIASRRVERKAPIVCLQQANMFALSIPSLMELDLLCSNWLILKKVKWGKR